MYFTQKQKNIKKIITRLLKTLNVDITNSDIIIRIVEGCIELELSSKQKIVF